MVKEMCVICFKEGTYLEVFLIVQKCTYMTIRFFSNFDISHTVSALLKSRRSIKLWGFFSGGVFKLFQFFPQKAPKRGLLEQKSAVLLEFCQSGGLIKSGLLFA